MAPPCKCETALIFLFSVVLTRVGIDKDWGRGLYTSGCLLSSRYSSQKERPNRKEELKVCQGDQPTLPFSSWLMRHRLDGGWMDVAWEDSSP